MAGAQSPHSSSTEAGAAHEQAKQARKAARKARRAAIKAGNDPDSDAVADAGDAAQAAVADDPDVVETVTQARAQATPTPKAQRNFTDPESRIMKTSDGSFHQCYNVQAIVDEHSQIIVASQLTNQAADAPHLPGMLTTLWTNLAAWPRLLLADAGYFSADDIDQARDVDVDLLVATGRFKHGEPPPPAPRGPVPKNATPKQKQKMARKLSTEQGRADYARRKAIVEPVFGQMHTRQNAHQVRLRGLDAARGEHQLHVLCHNILKLFTAGTIQGPAPA